MYFLYGYGQHDFYAEENRKDTSLRLSPPCHKSDSKMLAKLLYSTLMTKNIILVIYLFQYMV